MDLITADLRLVGSGMPLTQSSFDPFNSAIGDAALPILTNASKTFISFRINESGASTFLTSPIQPSSSSRTLSVASTTGFQRGDEVYLSNFPSAGNEGLRGVVESVGNGQIGLSASFTTTPNALFPEGSVLSPTRMITYANTRAGSVARTSSNGSVSEIPGVNFELTYMDLANLSLGSTVDLQRIKRWLGAIQVRAFSNSASRFTKKAAVIQLQESVTLRNLIVSR